MTCLSLWERWPNAARTERALSVTYGDSSPRGRAKTLSVTCGDSSPRGRAKKGEPGRESQEGRAKGALESIRLTGGIS